MRAPLRRLRILETSDLTDDVMEFEKKFKAIIDDVIEGHGQETIIFKKGYPLDKDTMLDIMKSKAAKNYYFEIDSSNKNQLSITFVKD